MDNLSFQTAMTEAFNKTVKRLNGIARFLNQRVVDIEESPTSFADIIKEPVKKIISKGYRDIKHLQMLPDKDHKRIIVETMCYASEDVQKEVREKYRELYINNEVLDAAYRFKNHNGAKGLLSKLWHNPDWILKSKDADDEVFNAYVPVYQKKELIRNWVNIGRRCWLVVIVDVANPAIEFINENSNRIALVAKVNSTKKYEKSYIVSDGSGLEYRWKVKKDGKYDVYSHMITYYTADEYLAEMSGAHKSTDDFKYVICTKDRREEINLIELREFARYFDIPFPEFTENDDALDKAIKFFGKYTTKRDEKGAWSVPYYDFAEYAGGDVDKVPGYKSGTFADINAANRCKSLYITSEATNSIDLTVDRLFEYVDYINELKAFIGTDRKKEQMFWKLDVIYCPCCTKRDNKPNKMIYKATATWSTCQYCGMSIPNPQNVGLDTSKIHTRRSRSIKQVVANAFYKKYGYVTYDGSDVYGNPDWYSIDDTDEAEFLGDDPSEVDTSEYDSAEPEVDPEDLEE